MRNVKKLSGKIALVTGGSRGIGKAICLRLASEGAFTIIHFGRNRSEAQETLEKVKATGGEGLIISADFCKAGDIKNLFLAIDEALLHRGSKIDILVNNAGIGCTTGIDEITEEKFDELLAINVKAPLFVTKEALKRLNNGGRIINLSSAVTRIAIPQIGPYTMTKAAIGAMTPWLAKQLGSRQIRVNTVSPGVVNTEMNAEGLSHPDSRKYLESLSTFNRVGEPNDIADVVAFLASDDSRWISGHAIDVSGGSFLG